MSLHVCVCPTYVPDDQRGQKRGHWVPQSWSYMSHLTWVLGIRTKDFPCLQVAIRLAGAPFLLLPLYLPSAGSFLESELMERKSSP